MIYDFKCPKCGVREEVVRKLKDWKKGLRCPSCGARMLRDFSFAVKGWPPKGTPRSHHRLGGGLFMEHLGPNGKTFYSESSLRTYCRRNNYEVEALL